MEILKTGQEKFNKTRYKTSSLVDRTLARIDEGRNKRKFEGLDLKNRCDITVALVNHSTEEEAMKMGEWIKRSAIVLIETLGWTRKSEKLLQDISDGKAEASSLASKSNFDKYFLKIFTEIEGTKKGVAFLDVPFHDKIYNETVLTIEVSLSVLNDTLMSEFKKERSPENFLALLKEIVLIIIATSELGKEREDARIDSFTAVILRALKQHSEIKEFKTIPILFITGASHTAFAEGIRELGYTKVKKLYRGSDYLTYWDQIKRHFQKTGESLKKPDKVKMAFLEIILLRAIAYRIALITGKYSPEDRGNFNAQYSMNDAAREALKKLKPDDAYRIYTLIPRDIYKRRAGEELIKVVEEFEKQKGAWLIPTEEELRVLMEKMKKNITAPV